MSSLPFRTGAAILLVLVTVAVAASVGIALQAVVVVLVGGVAAVLVAADPALAVPRIAEAAGDDAKQPPTAELLDALTPPTLLIADGRVTLANRAAKRLLGEHVEGEDVRVAIRHPVAAERLSADGAPPDGAIEIVGLGGRDQRWEMRVDSMSTGERIVYLLDRTGSHAAEQMRVDFVANASHELRTPLASILGYVETLRDEAGEDPAIRERFLAIMDDEARRMGRLVDDLISLSRIEADKYRLPEAMVDLAGLVEEVRDELVRAGGARASDVAVAIDDGLPAIAGDRAQLSQLLHNLIGNAMKYGHADTPVRVSVATGPRGMVRLSVADQGDGIAPEHLPRLTERFYRVDTGRSRSLGGTGLGLAIVKHVIERHRGRLDIASTPGRGTTVTVLLPPASGVIKG